MSSKPFDVIVSPFKFNTVPQDHLLTQLPLTIEVEFAPASNFVVPVKNHPWDEDSYFRVKLLEVKLELFAAPFTSEIIENFSFVRNHNIPHYSFSQWKMATALSRKGSMEVKTGALMRQANARRFIVAFGKKRSSGGDNGDWLDFKTLDLVRAVVHGAEDSPATEPIFYSGQQEHHQHGEVPRGGYRENTECTPFNCYLKHLDAGVERMPKQTFHEGNFFLCFDHCYSTGKADDFHVAAIFSKPLPYDITVYFLAEVSCELELGFTGRVMSFKELVPPKAMEKVKESLQREKRHHTPDPTSNLGSEDGWKMLTVSPGGTPAPGI